GFGDYTLRLQVSRRAHWVRQKAIRGVSHPVVLRGLRAIALAVALAASGLVAHAQAPGATLEAVPSALTADIMYRVLVGELALQRGEPSLAARAYYEAARDAQDPTLAQRATEIALFAKQRALAADAAALWQKLDPASERARQMVAMLASGGSSGDLKSDLEHVLADAAANGKTLSDAFLQLNRAL